MKKDEIKIGGIYFSKKREVEILEEHFSALSKRTHWVAKNLSTGRIVRIKSAASLHPARRLPPPERPVIDWGKRATELAATDLTTWKHPVPEDLTLIYDEWHELYKQDLAFREFVQNRYRYETNPALFTNLIKGKKGETIMAKKVTETKVTVTLDTLYAEVIALRDLVAKLTAPQHIETVRISKDMAAIRPVETVIQPGLPPEPPKVTVKVTGDIQTLLDSLKVAKEAKDDEAARKIRKSLRKLGYKLSAQNGK